MSEEQPADMLARLGSDAVLWAQEFNKTAVRLGYSEMDEDWLIGWFANAIENSCNPLHNECERLREELTALEGWQKLADEGRDKIEAELRAELAAAQEDGLSAHRVVVSQREKLDALRELLRDLRPWIKLDSLITRIDAALNKGGDDEQHHLL